MAEDVDTTNKDWFRGYVNGRRHMIYGVREFLNESPSLRLIDLLQLMQRWEDELDTAELNQSQDKETK